MATVAELAREHTDLTSAQIEHLQRLTRSMSLLSDLSFADVLLYAHAAEREEFVILHHVRPTTSQTLYRTDLVGETEDEHHRPFVLEAFRSGEAVEGDLRHHRLDEFIRVRSIPVRHEGVVIGVVTRDRLPIYRREASDLERTYLDCFDRLAMMISAGAFPFERDEDDHFKAPRVGDGLVVVDHDGRVRYASPNAMSALHRVDVFRNVVGRPLGDLVAADHAIHTAMSRRRGVIVEVERGSESTVVFRVIPLYEGDRSTGAIVLVRDISELRRRDRLLLSKDATIREIHHRVKNNLQTVSSLLRLQSRRLASEEARSALLESVRRIASIAVVHETLAQGSEGDVPFHEIVRPLVRLVEESLVSPDRPVTFTVTGTTGVLRPELTTPLAVVITELLQNAMDHAFPPGAGAGGTVAIELASDDDEVVIVVRDDGVGLPEGYSLAGSAGLGLTIVRTFVEADLGGTIRLTNRADGNGTEARLRVPVGEPL